MPKFTRALSPLVLLALAACKTPEGEPQAPGEPESTDLPLPPLDLGEVATSHVSVPLEMEISHHLAVEVDSPAGPLRFFVDTGASVSVLSEELADVLEVSPAPGGLVSVEGLSVGAVVLPSLQAALFDLSGANAGLAAQGSPPIDGILGADFLSGRAALIDYTVPALHLLEGELPSGLGPQLRSYMLEHGYEAVPLAPDLISFLWMEATLGGEGPLGALLDTGAAATAVELTTAEALDLELTEVAGGAATVGGALDTYATVVPQFELGSLALGSRELLVLDLSDINSQLGSVGLGPVEVLVGGDLLSERAAVVDYVGERLFLLP
jgi:predicted aspartyl protease